jgi:hypothetical protein
LLHPLGPNPVSELHQGSGFQNLAILKRVKTAEALPVNVLMKRLDGLLIGTIKPVLQEMNANHQANGLPLTTQRAVVGTQGIMETIPVNQAGGAKQFMLGIKNIRKQGFEHKKLPFWNMYFHINDL